MNFESILTTPEREAYSEGSLAMPRAEYAKGIEKLNFTQQFSTGETLNANEDDAGIANINIQKDGKEIYNFNDLKPIHYVTPSFYSKKGISMNGRSAMEGDWGNLAGIFEVQVGDMRDSKSIALLLHEVGHLIYNRKNTNKKYGYSNLAELWEHSNGPFTKKDKDTRKELAEEISKEERGAWAEGLKLARQLKKEKGFNLLEGFENLEDLQKIIYAGLISYRLGLGEKMIASDEGVIKDAWVSIKNKLGLTEENYGKEQWEFLQTIFDKNKLNEG